MCGLSGRDTRRFPWSPVKPEEYRRHAPGKAELDRIFQLRRERRVSADGVVGYENRFFQLERQRQHYAPAGGKVPVSPEILAKISRS